MTDVTVRQKLDELTSEPPVGDLGYPADQRLVASIMLGLQLLADEIDNLKRRPDAPDHGGNGYDEGSGYEAEVWMTTVWTDNGVDDLASQLQELTDQLKKLTKAVKKTGKR